MVPFTFSSMKILLFVCLFLNLFAIVIGSGKLTTFLVSFQVDRSRSTDHWMRYKEKIEVDFGKEFTSCHWERVRYFSLEINSIWSYSFKAIESDDYIQNIQFLHLTNTTTAGRTLDFMLNVFLDDLKEDFVVYSVPYRHREWNHICFTYSSIRKSAKFYYNGKVIKQYTKHNIFEIPSLLDITRSSFESSFTIAQEPDTVNGGYSSVQLFNGEISELNIWSNEIPEKQIEELSNQLKT